MQSGKSLTARSWLALLVVAFVAVSLIYVWLVPPFEGPDEPEHFGYVLWLAQGKGFPLAASILSLLTLAILIVAQWRSSEGSIGERIFTTIIETFEIVNNYVASSLSFLRVAAFSLNHVALSLAVFTLADGMGFVGHWITLILGNIFIIVLEGVIVTIQTLRLEYYEGFSRYFYGDGTPFRPLRVGRSTTR